MNGTRRTIGWLAAVLAMALLLAGPGAEAEAAVRKTTDFGSSFQFWCERWGGTYTDTGDGNTWCQLPDGSQIVCDSGGYDCYAIDAPPVGVRAHLSINGTLDEAPGTWADANGAMLDTEADPWLDEQQ